MLISRRPAQATQAQCPPAAWGGGQAGGARHYRTREDRTDAQVAGATSRGPRPAPRPSLREPRSALPSRLQTLPCRTPQHPTLTGRRGRAVNHRHPAYQGGTSCDVRRSAGLGPAHRAGWKRRRAAAGVREAPPPLFMGDWTQHGGAHWAA